MLSAGNNGCYLFCLFSVAEEVLHNKIDILQAIEDVIDRKYVYFNKKDYRDANNFYVQNPSKILEYLTNMKWLVTKEKPDYKIKSNEFAIERWTKNGLGHFARVAKGFNSLQHSNCVETGEIESLRVCKVIG